jgi:DNA-binding transcriptional regulator YiaG
LGLNQNEFAKLVRGVSQQKISDWESGKGLRAVAAAQRLLTVLSQVETRKA